MDTEGYGATSASVDRINAFLQEELRRRRVAEVAAVEAARWLDEAAVLKDSGSRPGLPLRNLLRAGRIEGGVQRPPMSHGRWFIERVHGPGGQSRSPSPTRNAPASGKTQSDLRATSEAAAARARRDRAARKYRPAAVKLLLVGEAPPSSLDRYFYFEDVSIQDSLFRYIARAILKVEPTRETKPDLLARLRDRGVFLIDLKRDPVSDGRSSLVEEVPGLVRRARRLAPERIIVVKTGVFDLVRGALLEAGLPLVDERVPFPGSGQQRRFEESFARALGRKPRRRAT